MCIIIAKTSSAKHPSEEVIRKCWASNSDGAGFAYGDSTGGVSISKGHMKLESLLAALERVRAVERSWYLLHFRIATHGSRGADMTHPFWVTKDKVALAHNGILRYSSLCDAKDGRSDTAAFTEDVLAKLPENWHQNEAFVHLIEDYLGTGNKFAIIDHDGIRLLNKSAWNEDKETGLWFSNYSWRPAQSYTNHNPTGTVAPYKYEGVYGYQPNQGGNQAGPTGAGKPTSGTSQTQLDFPGLTRPLRQASDAKHRAACLTVRQRCSAMVNAGLLAATDASAIREYIDEMAVLPEEAEDFLDFLQEQRDAVPGTTVDDALIVLGVKTILEAIEVMDEMRFGTDPGTPETLNFDAPDEDRDMPLDADIPPDHGNSTTKIIQAGKMSQADLEPEYNKDNCQCFLGTWVCIKRKFVDGNDIIARVTSIEAPGAANSFGFYYTKADDSEGWISFDCVKQVNGLMVLNRPAREHLVQFIGSDVIIMCTDNKAYRGHLQSVVGDTYKLRMAEHPLNVSDEISALCRVIIVNLKSIDTKQAMTTQGGASA